MIRLSAQNLTRLFPGGNGIKGLNFSLEAGSITALVGLNGAGKTTTLKCLAAHLSCQGSIELKTESEEEQKSAALFFLPEDKTLPQDLTPQDILKSADVNPEMVQYLCRKLDLSKVLQRRNAELSQGQISALYLVLAFSSPSPLLVLDEPLTGLDPYCRHIVQEELRHAALAGRSVIYSSHVLEEVEAVADQILILHSGDLLYAGSIDTLKEQYSEIILENPADPDTLRNTPGVEHLHTEPAGMTFIFLDNRFYDGSITGKRFNLNLKEIFLYLIRKEKIKGGNI